MSVRWAVLAIGLLAAPRAAWACAWCASAAFGDRSFNWPYLSLVIAPFIVTVAIGATLAWQAGIRPGTIAHWVADRLPGRRAGRAEPLHPDALPHKEPT